VAKSATVSLDLDVAQFRKKLAEALGLSKKLDSSKPTVTVGVDDGAIDEALAKKDKLSGTETVTVKVDDSKLKKGVDDAGGKVSKLGAIAGGALGGVASQAAAALGSNLIQGAKAADDFGDKLEVAFQQQGIADVDAEIEKVRKSSKNLANDLGLPAERTRELAGTVASLGGFTGKSAEDLTKLSAGLEVFTDGAVKGEAVAKAFSRGVADPEGAAAIDALSKKYPQLANTLRSNLSPTEKLAEANKVLGKSFDTVKEQQSDAGGILNRLQNELGDLFQTIGTQLLDAIAPIAQSLLPILESLLPVLQSILTPLAPILERIGGLVVTVVQKLAGPLTKLLDAVLTPLLDLVTMLIEPLTAIISVALEPLTIVIDAVADALKQFLPALIQGLAPILPIITNLFVKLAPVIAQVAGVLGKLIVSIVTNRAIMLALNLAVGLLAFALDKLVPIIELVVGAIAGIVSAAAQAVTYISNLISAIASFDLGKIKDALLGNADAANEVKKSTEGAAKATGEQAAAQKDLNNELKKQPPPPDPEKAKAYAEALKKAREELRGLNTEQAKQAELLKADSLATEEERAKARIAIEEKYAIAALEVERKALTSRGELRKTEEAIIDKRIEILRADNARKLLEIQGKAEADRVKVAEEAEKKIGEITNKLAEERVARLRAILEAGGVAVASELIAAQRAIVDNQLSATVDAIAESTPEFKAGAEKIASELLGGIIDANEARKRTAELRQRITGELLALPATAGNAYALQLRAAYDKAAQDIGKGTKDVTDSIKKAIDKSGTEQYVKSLYGIKDAIAGADFSTPFEQSAEATNASNEALEKLIQSVKDGEETYQSAALKYAEIDKQRSESASVTASLIAEALRATAQSQLDAAKQNIDAIEGLRARNQEIADELISIEERKNAALAALRQADFANQELYEGAKKEIADAAALEQSKLQAEQTKNSEDAAKKQEAALLQIGTAAGTALAGLVTGSQSASEALKSIAATTVQSLLDLYAGTIIAGFASVIPGPFGIVAGTAAVAALKALVSSALSGFSEGGYTGNAGTSQVAGVVHGREFVINARDTSKNRALLEHINKGGTVDSFAGAPVSEFQMMRAELQAIRQRLDNMPNGFSGRQSVALDVGFDTYLFERDRRKAAVRGIRG
jgi:phage-related protein